MFCCQFSTNLHNKFNFFSPHTPITGFHPLYFECFYLEHFLCCFIKTSSSSRQQSCWNLISFMSRTNKEKTFQLHCSMPKNMTTEIVPNTLSEMKNEENSMKRFCKEIFPDIKKNINTPGWLDGRIILAPTNKEVDALNSVVQDWLSEAGVKLSSADTLENPEDNFRFNTEYLNTLKPNGFPSHLLILKPECL